MNIYNISDKNPHPDAKQAFDALKDSFEVLSSELQRITHDEELELRRWGFLTKLTVPKVLKYLTSLADNLVSRALLFKKRMLTGEMNEEISELEVKYKKIEKCVRRLFLHFQYLPTVQDRLDLFVELVFNKKVLIILALLKLLGFL